MQRASAAASAASWSRSTTAQCVHVIMVLLRCSEVVLLALSHARSKPKQGQPVATLHLYPTETGRWPPGVIGREQALSLSLSLSLMDREKVVGLAQTHPSTTQHYTFAPTRDTRHIPSCWEHLTRRGLIASTGYSHTRTPVLPPRATTFTRSRTTGLDFARVDFCALALTETSLINTALSLGLETTEHRPPWPPNRESCWSSSWETTS